MRLAALAGLLHAAASLYWALGGRWLLDTVGAWAVELAASAPVSAGLALGGIALVKALGGVVPLLVEAGRWPGSRRWWRALEWVGAAGLLLYGGVNAVVAGLVLAGVIRPDGGYDAAAMWGHAALWDPLFALWGLALGIGLWRSRRPSA